MFTGIVTEVGQVISLQPDQLAVRAGLILKGVELGASIAVNGACLTVTHLSANSFTVGLASETLTRTNLGGLKSGDPVNLERPLGFGAELGGHLVQGHIDGAGEITDLRPAGGSTVFRFAAPPEIMRYVVEKGFIAIDGVSLTITGRSADYFEIAIIDYTRSHTIFSNRRIGDKVNIEIDIMAKYAERFMQTQPPRQLTVEYLREQGF
jgi:riboflavin synthase